MKDADKAGDLAAIDTASKELNDAWQAASQDMYSAQQGQEAQPNGSANGGSQQSDQNASGDNVTDVEFEEVN